MAYPEDRHHTTRSFLLTPSAWASFATIIIAVICSTLPLLRGWGGAAWGALPGWAQVWHIGLTGLAVILVAWLGRPGRAHGLDAPDGPSDHGARSHLLLAALVALLVATFWSVRAETHFLGDGYQQLSRLEWQNPFLRNHDLGAEAVCVLVHRLLPDTWPDTPRTAYQIVSVAAGLLFAVIAALGAVAWVHSLRGRLLFVLGLTTSGYSLQFFGYVENYSLLLVAILVFSLTGLAVATGRWSTWTLWPPLLLAGSLHVFGWALVPAAAFVYLAKSPSRFIQRLLSFLGKPWIWILLVMLAFPTIEWLRSKSLLMRLVALPLATDAYTVDGYTLLSFAHGADFANLIIQLLPGIGVFVVARAYSVPRGGTEQIAYRYLRVLTLSTLGVVFVLYPGLGMPRDWDLLAFPGVPLALLSYFALLRSSPVTWSRLVTATLAVVLGLSFLLARAFVQHSPEAGIRLAQGYFELDVQRSRTGLGLLSAYYFEKGDRTRYLEIEQRRSAVYPEEDLADSTQELLDRGDIDQASRIARRLRAINPRDFSGWLQGGRCLLLSGQQDSAVEYLTVAHALNPGNYDAKSWLGYAHFEQGNRALANRLWIEAVSIDSMDFQALECLGISYLESGDYPRAVVYLRRAGSKSGAPASVFLRLGYAYQRLHRTRSAVSAFRVALEKGADTLQIQQVLREAELDSLWRHELDHPTQSWHEVYREEL